MIHRPVVPKRAMRQLSGELTDVPDLDALLVRAFVEERGLTVRRNEPIQAAMDRAESPAELLAQLRHHGIPLNFPLIDRLLEGRLTRSDRKTSGAVYTPEHVVRFLCGRLFVLHPDRSADGWRVLDPAVGAGAFLIGMAQALRSATRNAPSEIVERQLYGVDIDPDSVATTDLLLNLWALDAGEDAPRLRTNLLIADSLAGERLADRFAAPEGFDAVIGNPPYVRIQNLAPAVREQLRRTWHSARVGNIDLYIPFIELGLREVSETGIVGYIAPTTFTATDAGRPLREMLARDGAITELYDFGDRQVFENVTTYSGVLFLSRQRTERFRYLKAASADTIPEEPAYGTISVNRLNPRRWQLYSDDVHATIQALECGGTPLGKLARIGVGIATLADGCYLLDGGTDAEGFYTKEAGGRLHRIEPGITKPILKASRIKSEEDIRRNRERIVFPYRRIDGKHRIIPEAELRRDFPNAAAYLDALRERLDQRDRGKPNPVAWYAFGRSQGLDTGFSRKLLTSGMNLRPNFVLCEDEAATFYAGYCIQPRYSARGEAHVRVVGVDVPAGLRPAPTGPSADSPAWNTDLRVLRTLLNSSLMAFYIHHTSRSYQHGYKSYAKSFLERFGVPTLTQDDARALLAASGDDQIVLLLDLYGIDLARHAGLAAFLDVVSVRP
ncbi:hypothetical protein FJZ36_14050 [Candidatus Poribacteria bacterium]|nr:hypothetical protein [Candidatus Poribacteria bacterium]